VVFVVFALYSSIPQCQSIDALILLLFLPCTPVL
jgi:hypothetical protein